jgi:ribosomal protein S18 acetylase RimI-like enzyme
MTHATSIRTSAPPGLSFRRITDADLPFLAEVYASTRREEIAHVPWTDADKAAFLRWQFDNQHHYYQQYYPNCEFLIIEKPNGASAEAIGRLYVDRWPDEIRLVDIALLPSHRREGHGSALLRSILDEGRASGLPVSIHVEANNPAMTLYRRLGFVHVDSNGVYHLMRWEPPSSASGPR